MREATGTGAVVHRHDDAVFAELYRRHHRPVRDFCRRRVASHLVDDAVAETFLAAWRRLNDIPPGGGDTLVWLYTVAYRVIGHQRRASARRRRLDDRLRAIAVRPGSGADEGIVTGDEYRLVWTRPPGWGAPTPRCCVWWPGSISPSVRLAAVF